jgi:hypothetical protein
MTMQIAAALRGAPAWITPDVVRDTIQTFLRFYNERLTPGEAVSIILNNCSLFELLEHKSVKSDCSKQAGRLAESTATAKAIRE